MHCTLWRSVHCWAYVMSRNRVGGGSTEDLLLYQGETKLGLLVPASIYQQQLPFIAYFIPMSLCWLTFKPAPVLHVNGPTGVCNLEKGECEACKHPCGKVGVCVGASQIQPSVLGVVGNHSCTCRFARTRCGWRWPWEQRRKMKDWLGTGHFWTEAPWF